MKKTDRYIIFLDIDGTLISKGKVHGRTRDGIRRAKEAGHLVFINSGRPLCYIENNVTEPVSPDGIVSAMGTCISIGDETVFSSPLSREDIVFISRFGEERGYYTLFESKDIIVVRGGKEIGSCSETFHSTEELLSRFADISFTKASFNQPIPPEDAEILRERFPSLCVHSRYVEIPSGSCNKATAMEWLCNYYGIDRSHTVAMGDSLNDTDMLCFAGISVAMGNSLPEIKEMADMVTLPCYEGGVGYAIEKLLLKNRLPRRDAYLFDFDGTLVDSMPTFVSVMLRILDEYGVEYGDDIVKIITPLGYRGTAEYFRTLGVRAEVGELMEKMNAYALKEYAESIPEKEGVREALISLKESGASLNVLTASPHLMLDPCLKRLGLFELFDNVWSCDDFGTTKADPEIYRMAADKIGRAVGDIIFVDDNPNAVSTAKRAGMISYGIYDQSSEGLIEEMREVSDGYAYSLGELL